MIVILGVPILQGGGRILPSARELGELTQVLPCFSAARPWDTCTWRLPRGTLIAIRGNGSGRRRRTWRPVVPAPIACRRRRRSSSTAASTASKFGKRATSVTGPRGSRGGHARRRWPTAQATPARENLAFLVIVRPSCRHTVIRCLLAYCPDSRGLSAPDERRGAGVRRRSAGRTACRRGWRSGVSDAGFQYHGRKGLRKHHDELERLSTTDTLTGLSNRRHLMSLLAQELERAKRADRPFSILS